MADNVAITAGSGTTIATDDVSGVHYQKVKLYGSTDGTEVVLSRAEDAAHTDGDHGLLALGVRNYTGAGTDGDYSAFSVSAEGNQIVEPRSRMVRTSVASGGLTTATTAYSAGDQVGTQFTITGASRANGGFGYITGVHLIDASNIIGAYDVVFFRASVTPASDNAAFAISDADALELTAYVQLTGAFNMTNNRVAMAQNIRIPYETGSGTSLYALLTTRSGHTFFGATTALQLVVHMELM